MYIIIIYICPLLVQLQHHLLFSWIDRFSSSVVNTHQKAIWADICHCDLVWQYHWYWIGTGWSETENSKIENRLKMATEIFNFHHSKFIRIWHCICMLITFSMVATYTSTTRFFLQAKSYIVSPEMNVECFEKSHRVKKIQFKYLGVKIISNLVHKHDFVRNINYNP